MTILENEQSTVDTTNSEWRYEANCSGELHLFFAKKAERPQARARREAKANALCQKCSVIKPCREYARRNREYGFWAGESEEDRHLLGYTVSAPIGLRSRKYRTGEISSTPAALTNDLLTA